MQYVADLHLHSKYSRAVSQQMILPEMARWAVKKGINLLTTSDFTHPLWLRTIKGELKESGNGIYKLKNQNSKIQDVRFILSTEIASIYKEKDKLRRIHNLVFAPDFETADKINKELVKRGCNLHSDGRPIIGISSKNLLELVLSIDERTMLIPCHVWTPHFGVYGSKSGFDSLEETFGNLNKYVYGIETGISSDPEMNWRVKELSNRSILSFSDAHSPANMGREATVFVGNKNGISNDKSQISNKQITYDDIKNAIKRDPKGNLRVGYTIEFYPEEGKYHFSGHRNCKISLSPEEVVKKGSICPVCQREITEGVAVRIVQLAGEETAACYKEKISEGGIKWYTDSTRNHPPYVKLVPLLEIIAGGLGSTVSSQKVRAMSDNLCEEFGSEIDILLKTPVSDITSKFGEKIAEGVAKVRCGDIFIDPGFDGEYGKVKIWSEEKPATGISNVNQEAQLGLEF